MERKIGLLLLAFTMIVTSIGNVVRAETVDEYKAGDYKYIMEKLAIRLYPLDIEEDVGGAGEDDGGAGEGEGGAGEGGISPREDSDSYGQGNCTEESFSKYQRNEYAEEIEIPLSSVTFTPSTFAKDIDGLKMQIVELRADLTEEKITQLIEDKVSDVSDDRIYVGELVVYYKVTASPSGLDKLYTVNVYKHTLYIIDALLNIFSPSSSNYENPDKPTELNEVNTQILNMITATTDGITFYRKAEDTEPVLSLLNYLGVSTTEDDPDSCSGGLMITNVQDIDYLVATLFSMNMEDPTVDVPDTGWNKNILFIILGLLLMIIGIKTVTRVIQKES